MWNNSPLENPGMDNRERSRYGRPEERMETPGMDNRERSRYGRPEETPGRGYMAPGVCNERGAGNRGCSFMESPTTVFNSSYAGGLQRQDGGTMQYTNMHVHNLYPNNPARQNVPSSGASSPQMGFQDNWNSRPDIELPNCPPGFMIGPQNSRPIFQDPGPPRGIYPLRPYPSARPMLPPMGDPYAPRPAYPPMGDPYGPPRPGFPPSGFPSNLPSASQPQYPGQPGNINPKPPRPGFPDQPRYY